MKTILRGAVPLIAIAVLAAPVACGPSDDPQIVAIAYVRAANSGDPDTAVRLLDVEQITSRVEEHIVVVDSSGSESFLEDSIESLLWGLFQEARQSELAYNAPPPEIDGDTARVSVTTTSPDGDTEVVIVHLRNTDAGWRVSGESLDRLITFVIQRLQEKY